MIPPATGSVTSAAGRDPRATLAHGIPDLAGRRGRPSAARATVTRRHPVPSRTEAIPQEPA
jgi:hypothetical protein